MPADTTQRRHIFLGKCWLCPCPTTVKASLPNPAVKRRAPTWPAQPWAPLVQICRWTLHLDLSLGAAMQWNCTLCPALSHREALPCYPRGKAPGPSAPLHCLVFPGNCCQRWGWPLVTASYSEQKILMCHGHDVDGTIFCTITPVHSV